MYNINKKQLVTIFVGSILLFIFLVVPVIIDGEIFYKENILTLVLMVVLPIGNIFYFFGWNKTNKKIQVKKVDKKTETHFSEENIYSTHSKIILAVAIILSLVGMVLLREPLIMIIIKMVSTGIGAYFLASCILMMVGKYEQRIFKFVSYLFLIYGIMSFSVGCLDAILTKRISNLPQDKLDTIYGR